MIFIKNLEARPSSPAHLPELWIPNLIVGRNSWNPPLVRADDRPFGYLEEIQSNPSEPIFRASSIWHAVHTTFCCVRTALERVLIRELYCPSPCQFSVSSCFQWRTRQWPRPIWPNWWVKTYRSLVSSEVKWLVGGLIVTNPDVLVSPWKELGRLNL